MRILQVGKFYPPVHGGMERVVQELCEGFTERGHEVAAICASRDKSLTRETRNGVSVVRLRTRGQIFSQPLISGLREEIRRFSPDIVHFHLPNPLALRTGWVDEVPTCLTLHAEAGGLKKSIDRMITRPFVNRARALIFSSEQMAARWRRLEAMPRIRVIPFGFKFSYLETPLAAVQDPTLVLFVGRLVGYKGIEVLIKAMERVSGKLAVIGSGPAENSLRSLVERRGLNGKVLFLGALPDSSLVDWYGRCAVYVQPSVNECEAFGISMLEAMHMARPIVSTDLATGVKAVNQHLRTGLVVPPRDSVALAAALNTLLTDQVLAHRLGSAAHEHEFSFSRDAMVDRHLDLYESLVGRLRPQQLCAPESAPLL